MKTTLSESAGQVTIRDLSRLSIVGAPCWSACLVPSQTDALALPVELVAVVIHRTLFLIRIHAFDAIETERQNTILGHFFGIRRILAADCAVVSRLEPLLEVDVIIVREFVIDLR